MKKRYLIVPVLLTLLTSPALAEMSTTSRVRVNDLRRAEMDARRDAARSEMEAKRASSTERREDRSENRVERKASSTERRIEMQIGLAKKKAEHTARVLTATVERLEKIITRLESRIAKVKASGGVTTESERFVAEAKAHFSLARSSIALLAFLDLSGEKARDNFEKVRVAAAEAKDHIREAHRSLKEATRSLKGVRRDGTHEQATTTATSTSE